MRIGMMLRGVVLALALLGVAAGSVDSQAASTDTRAPRPAVLAVGVDAVGMTVSDMDRSVAFYTEVLDFTRESDVEVAGPAYERLTGLFGVRMRVVRLRLGEEFLELTEYLAAEQGGRPAPVDSRSNDQWFQHIAIIVRDMDAAYARLRQHKVRHASTGPQRLPPTIPEAAGIEAFYFRDPDGHPLEILAFPRDKGNPKWHRPTDRLFLGIDHTAIVVSNTERSLAFYRDVLGLTVAGGSMNFGTEQEHLNNVEGARLRITGLRGASGPGIEFLEYLEPRTGRPTPADVRMNDLVHVHTTIRTTDAVAALHAVGLTSALLSRGVTELPPDGLGFTRGVVVLDPDGHALQLIDG